MLLLLGLRDARDTGEDSVGSGQFGIELAYAEDWVFTQGRRFLLGSGLSEPVLNFSGELEDLINLGLVNPWFLL